MTNQNASPDALHNSRPKPLALLAILVFGFSLFQLYSFSQIILAWKTLIDLSLSNNPVFLAACNLAWGCTGVLISFGLWTGKRWARIGCMSYWILFSVYSWIKLIWIVEPTTLQTRWPVNLVLTTIGLGAVVVILNLKSTRSYLGKNTVRIP